MSLQTINLLRLRNLQSLPWGQESEEDSELAQTSEVTSAALLEILEALASLLVPLLEAWFGTERIGS